LGLSSKYYDFAVKGWRFVVLDGNDVSFHAYPEGSEGHRAAELYYQNMTIESPKWNGAVGPDQMSWLEDVLTKAATARENVVVYCHFPVFPEGIHNLWNASEVVQLIEAFPCVKAFINGHNHAGNYDSRNGIHYLTLKGMVNTLVNSYAVIQATEDSLIVTGYGREEDRILKLEK
jgi:3',5'-cyclic AMP phosphodiesterase CpdA